MTIDRKTIVATLKNILMGLISLIPGILVGVCVFGAVAIFKVVATASGFAAGWLFILALFILLIATVILTVVGKFVKGIIEKIRG